jgi:hypothetical protein
VVGIKTIQDFQHVLLLAAGNLLALREQIDHLFGFQESQKIPGIRKSPGSPDKMNVSIPETGDQAYTNANFEAHNFRCLQQFRSGFRPYVTSSLIP